jgi:hypothetical protein
MVTIQPPMSIRTLTSADRGSLVNVNGQFALAAVWPQDPQQRLSLALFEPATGIFHHAIYDDAEVLVFGSELIFEPELTSAGMPMIPGTTGCCGCEAFLYGAEVHIVMKLPAEPGPSYRLINLHSGALTGLKSNVTRGFSRWRLGCKGSEGQITWLLTVAPPETWSAS